MFEISGNEYELKYNLKRIELIEAATGEPLMASLQKNRAMLSISHLKIYFSLALKEVGADGFVPPKKGQEFAEALIESEGYEYVNMCIVEALQRDCPFFFRVA